MRAMLHAACRRPPPQLMWNRPVAPPRTLGSLSTIAHLLGTHYPPQQSRAARARDRFNTEEGQQVRISVFGLGYVGAVSCACLPELGHEVIGVDTNPLKVRMINEGQSPVVEEGINELIDAGVTAGKLRATDDLETAVLGSEISLISVATPS